jgi:hypothetical protein
MYRLFATLAIVATLGVSASYADITDLNLSPESESNQQNGVVNVWGAVYNLTGNRPAVMDVMKFSYRTKEPDDAWTAYTEPSNLATTAYPVLHPIYQAQLRGC